MSPILQHWLADCSERETESLNAHGGLSGAKLWRITQQGKTLCLRRWPKQHPDSSHLSKIHGLMQHLVAAEGVTVPEVLRTKTGETMVVSDGHLWELTTWLPGTADYHANPRPEKLDAAMEALARIHRAAESVDCQFAESHNTPLLQRRLQRLQAFQQNELKAMASANVPQSLCQLAQKLIPFIESSLAEVIRRLV